MLTIEVMYDLASDIAQRLPTVPTCDHDDLAQSAVIGLIEAGVEDVPLARVVARRRMIDELRRHRGRAAAAEDQRTASPRDAAHLFAPAAGDDGRCLADTLPADDDTDGIDRLIDHIDASRDVGPLLRALDRRRRRMLLLHVVEECSTDEIARRYGVSRARVSQLVGEARERARRVAAARGATVPPIGRRSFPDPGDPAALDATAAEKRAFGEFRRLQRAGLRRQEALAALPEPQRLLVAEYQRKCQRRVRARAAGQAVPKQSPHHRYDLAPMAAAS
jgi:RNA polymerase sigma factor (sigma-70 family)